MVSEVSAQRSAVPAVSRFRRRAQLLADVHEKHAGSAAETRTKRFSPRRSIHSRSATS